MGLDDRGISPNVASFVGATTLREHTVGHADRKPSAEELNVMRSLTRQAMEDGALGVGSSLIRGSNDFTADIVLTDGRPSAKVGRSYKPNPRLSLVE